ncbi:hypothetical protein PR048_025246 [Dryococelus australis]|uniref:SERTA domain-containing protein n=1 Tax=Dryococelus australis TaxID=614101 RepID=A0ABQ9GQR3_9NEOP|nr:hypothetical protein PR048_025246 [Dryococelus australis]
MGLQVTANKRKLEEDGARLQPAKVGRRDEMLCDVCGGSVLATALLQTTDLGDPTMAEDEEDDEDEEEEDEEEDDKNKYFNPARSYPCIRYGGEGADCYSSATELKGMSYYGAGEDHGSYGGNMLPTQYHSAPHQYLPARTAYWGSQNVMDSASGVEYYNQDSGSQQTIRCDENGKSYLDLGSSSARYVQNGAANSAVNGPDKLVQQRPWLGVLPPAQVGRPEHFHVQIGEIQTVPRPSLHRSVLICNTLRYIEREMEQEGFFFNSPVAGNNVQTPMCPLPQPPPPVEPASSYAPSFPEVPAIETMYRGMDISSPYEQNLREFSSSGRATPFPHNYETDSGLGDDESGRGINWGSVLSLSSQSDLDPLNNNELYPPSPPSDSQGSLCLLPDMDLGQELDDFLPSWKLTPLSAEDILKTVPSPSRQSEGELDSIMHVLVGT